MQALERVPVEQAIRQLEFWLSQPWPMSEAKACRLAPRIGWELAENGFIYAREFLQGDNIQVVLGMSNRDTPLSSFSFSLTGLADKEDPLQDDQLKDVFAEFVSAGRATWGPAALVKDPSPGVRWDFGDHGGIRIERSRTVSAVYMTPEEVATLKNLNDW